MNDAIAVLASGGLDSCVLLAQMAQQATVYPIYLRAGLIWENEEYNALQAFIGALESRNIQPVTTLALAMQPFYANHWSVSGCNIPSQHDPESKTFLPGRNVLLLSLAAVWCSLHDVHRIALGTLSGNAFADASLDFFEQMSKTLSTGLDFPIHIMAPYREKYEKADLIRDFPNLPLELSLTCLSPLEGKHCGQCNKCCQRKAGYKAAGVLDRTTYVK
jgi:7-cyano-7-deazaguanine synthase